MIRTLLRVLIGGLFVGHGTQKLFGWFGGYGPDGTGQFFESIGLRPGRRSAMIAGASEAGGGALLAAGLFTPIAGALITGVMAQAIRSLKMDKGPFATDGGWELEALFAAAALTFVEIGPGPCRSTTRSGRSTPAPAGRCSRSRPGSPGRASWSRAARRRRRRRPPPPEASPRS